MRYLVTGAAGFIGSHLAERLCREGHEVVGLDVLDDFYSIEVKRQNLTILSRFGNFNFLQQDILDPATYEALEGPFDAVFHLAAKAGVRRSLEIPVEYARVNVEGTARVLEYAMKEGIPKVIIASSSSVYGRREEGPFREEDRTDQPISPYAATKKAVEVLARGFWEKGGLDIVLLRYFTVFGPRVRPDLAIYKFTTRILRGEDVPVYGDGSAKRDYTYVGDVVDGTIRSLGVSGYEILNIGSGRPIELLDLIGRISRILGLEPKLKFLPPQKGDVPLTWADITKAARLIGYSPTKDFDVVLEETVKSIVETVQGPGE